MNETNNIPQQPQIYNENDLLNTKLYDLQIIIQKQNQIFKNTQQLNGKIILTPKHKMYNIPIEVTIIGQSYCSLTEQQRPFQPDKYHIQTKQQLSSRVYQTQSNLIDQKKQNNKFNQSSQQLKETITQQSVQQSTSTVQSIQIQENFIMQTFLQGKQTLFQYFSPKSNNKQHNKQLKQKKIQQQQTDNSIKQKEKQCQIKNKLNFLQQDVKYQYKFTFCLPKNLPTSFYQQIFQGLRIHVNYKIIVQIKNDEKDFVFSSSKMHQTNNKLNKNDLFKDTIKHKAFTVLRQKRSMSLTLTTNKSDFKYFHRKGIHCQSSQIGCCEWIFRLFRQTQQTHYDIYHCEVITHIDEQNNLFITGRVFMQPLKDGLDQRKIKKGKMYFTTKNQNNQSIEKKTGPTEPSQMTNSKFNDDNVSSSDIKIKYLLIRLYGAVDQIKKELIFSKVLHLSNLNYDAVQGELITELDEHYFSQKNELFQIKYWFQVFPIDDADYSIIQQLDKLNTNLKQYYENTRQIHLSQFFQQRYNNKMRRKNQILIVPHKKQIIKKDKLNNYIQNKNKYKQIKKQVQNLIL